MGKIQNFISKNIKIKLTEATYKRLGVMSADG